MNIFKYKNDFSLKDLIINILIPVVGGALVGFININSSALYNELKQPVLAPPSIIFSIVWPILYLLMGLAAYRITLVLKNTNVKKGELFFYYIQLLLNFLWPFLFFTFRLYGLAFIELIILIVFIIITTIKFYMADKLSALLMLPYLIWSLYAAYLNCAIWLLNEA